MIDDDIEGTVTVCAGEPVCYLQNDDAIAAQRKGCLWCRRIYFLKDGSEIEFGPSPVRH